MVRNIRQDIGPSEHIRVRSPDLIRPADRRRDFTSREAQRRLEEKERPHWALVAYGVFLAAVVAIFAVAYTTYAFSEYRGVILPGVHVDQLSLAGMTSGQANKALLTALGPIYNQPVRLVYSSYTPWTPSASDIGYEPDVNATLKEAEQIGRSESFLEQLLDRLPLHPDHSVPLIYRPNDSRLRSYILGTIGQRLTLQPQNAGLRMDLRTNHVALIPSHPGHVLDLARTVAAVDEALGTLTPQTKTIVVDFVRPAITNAYARSKRQLVEAFLSNTPVIAFGKRVIVTNRAAFAPMLRFDQVAGKGRIDIVMKVNPDAVSAYVASLAKTIDRQSQNPQLDYQGGRVLVLAPLKTGLQLDQSNAQQQLLNVITRLKPHARLHFKVTVTQPPRDISNPASLGIDTLLGIGETSFRGAGSSRLDAITLIAGRLNKILLPPDGDISFNTLVGTGWSDNVYTEQEREVAGHLVPGHGGAMQQVATTFFRALYASGLQVEERHAHVHRFSWYEPPVGLDAVVAPGSGYDLRFRNSAAKYLFLKVRVEPIRKELYIYVYGPKLGWKVSIDPLGKVTKVYPHGPDIVKQDQSLTPGTVAHTAWAHDGADTVIERTIEYPNGTIKTDRITSHYQPWQSIILIGYAPPRPTPTVTPTPKATASAQPTVTVTPSPTPQPSATPTPTQ